MPVDAGDDGVVVTMSVKVLRTDAWTDVVIVFLAVVIVVRAVIAFGLFVTASCMVDV